MCGIAGIVDFRGPPEPGVLRAMRDAIAHRGPDGAGEWYTSAGPPFAALGHRRLSIVDLSELGRQPMISPDERYALVFNGEIYNFRCLAKELEARGRRFRSQGDTEVLLAALAEWGLEAFPRLNGMWALALWDAHERRLWLSRDRMGKKPLYYRRTSWGLLFASEVKAILRHPEAPCAPDEEMVERFARHRLPPPDDRSMFAGVDQLPPAHHLFVDRDGSVRVQRYWQLDARRVAEEGTLPELTGRFRELFSDAVRLRMMADVPIGSSLSGGLDSSLIVGTMAGLRRESGETAPQHTFSARFPADGRIDEGRFIDAVVGHSGALGWSITPASEELLADVASWHYHHEEPLLSTSVFAQWKVMQLAREHSTVVLLDGQGSDELLAGYAPHEAVHLADLVKSGQWGEALGGFRAALARQRAVVTERGGYDSGGGLWNLRTIWGRAFRSLSRTRRINAAADEPPIPSPNRLWQRLFEDLTRRSLPVLLRYADRNSMAFGVEVRNPFLDHRLVEWLMSVPGCWKLRDGWSKYLLREASDGLMPDAVRWRRDKIAFATPEDQWLRGPLGQWGEAMLHSPELNELPWFPSAHVRRRWAVHQSGRANLRAELWPWLSLGQWLSLVHSGAFVQGVGRPYAALREPGSAPSSAAKAA